MIETESSLQKTYTEPSPMIGYANFDAAGAPTVNDDESAGYSINSIWYKETIPYRLWICTDNLDGAATWREIPLTDYRNTRSIFDHYTNVTTTGTGQETLHTGTVPAYTFFENGDEVRIVYRGFFGNNANQKEFLLDMDLANYFGTGALTKNGGAWKIEVHITRVASDSLGIFSKYEDALTTVTDISTSAGLDLTNDIDFLFRVITPDLAGDITLSTAKAVFYPAAPVVAAAEGVEFLATGLEFGGVAVEFTA